MPGKLYVVGTPIGNLSDFSPRAIETLKTVDIIAAEDTRVTAKLLNKFEINTPLVSYHEHNLQKQGPWLVNRILAGEACALVTDAGMPAISDPGEQLVRLCHENGIGVESVPGPSALVTALAISGMPSKRFCFEGFLSHSRPRRLEHLESLKNEPRTMIFYEAPHKLPQTLKDMLEVLGDRNIAIVKELTKIHEEVTRTTLSLAAAQYDGQKPKGEYVLIVEGAPQQAKPADIEEAVELARGFMQSGMPASAAAKEAAAATGHKKGEIYSRLVK
ncbi:MAG TPA: 16S rRNA (cytidine(1402)-2'-O)-methyltransferase [Clostridiales bacterium]|nr:16S rRNA (cytidine(1402)-2'-O)-methyltransferase [Clostridiales bacterium]